MTKTKLELLAPAKNLESGIAQIINCDSQFIDNSSAFPKCELYLSVYNIQLEFDNALQNGAILRSPILDRDWGDKACYFSDPDGYLIVFAQNITK